MKINTNSNHWTPNYKALNLSRYRYNLNSIALLYDNKDVKGRHDAHREIVGRSRVPKE